MKRIRAAVILSAGLLLISGLPGVWDRRNNTSEAEASLEKKPVQQSTKAQAGKQDTKSKGKEEAESNRATADINESNHETEEKKSIPGMDSKYLVLVNKEHPLENPEEPELATVSQGGVKVSKAIMKNLEKMIRAAGDAGHTIIVASGYRPLERQQTILDNNITKLVNQGMSYADAYQEATREVMPAGYSEHETGLAVDIVGVGYQLLEQSQEQMPENQWLRKYCSEYGFILRYPKGKEEITKIDYEPWHFRYVGPKAARYITRHNLTLEEYLDLK